MAGRPLDAGQTSIRIHIIFIVFLLKFDELSKVLQVHWGHLASLDDGDVIDKGPGPCS